MDSLSYIPLEKIQANPYQTREREDSEHIQRLALSIAQHGLLQIPSGRPIGRAGKVISMQEADAVHQVGAQLAFGHSRLAAYRLLDQIRAGLLDKQPISFEDDSLYAEVISAADKAVEAGESWGMMPVNLVDMTDEEMFSAACTENSARQDLTPIDEARAMLRWKTDFGKTSEEIGRIFALSASTVRNKMRLVELPEQAQEVIASGKVTEHAARRLLTLRDTLGDAALGEVAVELAGQHFDKPSQADAFIEDRVHNDPRTKRMYYSYQEDQKTAGDGMWPLDWKAEVTILPNARQVGQMLPDPQQAKELKSNIQATLALYLSDRDDEGKRCGDPDVVAAVEHMVHLPACANCKHFLRIRHDGYCGRKVCWEYKRDLWHEQELRRISKDLGVSIYDPSEDGEVFESAPRWSAAGLDRFRQMLIKDKGHLRLRIGEVGWNKTAILDHAFVEIVSISDESCARVQQAKTSEERQAAEERQGKVDRERYWKNYDLSKKYIKVVAELFGSFFFQSITPAQLAILHRAWGRTEVPDSLDAVSKKIAYQKSLGNQLLIDIVNNDWSGSGPVSVAKYLAGVAREIGLELPEDWIEQAQQFENGEIVDAEEEAVMELVGEGTDE
jgi:ParB-like chromosome segregation protein Spo0J